MPGAITMSYDYTDSQDTGDPEDDTGLPEDDTGDFLSEILGGGTQLISSILSGSKGKPGQGIGQGLGALAGAGLGTLAGGAGAGIGAALGKAAGGAVESLVRSQTVKKKPPAKKPVPAKKAPPHAKRTRVPTKRERKMLLEAAQMSRRTGEPGYSEEVHLRVYRPAEYKRRRDAQLLWSQNIEPDESQDARLSEFDESPYLDDSTAPYDDTAAPETRPQPRKHISTVPMSSEQLAALLRAVPQLQSLDPRQLRTMSGSVSVARDVSGVDPTTGTYHALPGETPHGITKKLTGQVERTQELLAANPGKSPTSTEWNIPPGWLQYAKETGAPTFITSRKYTVVVNDTPIGIAKKMSAFADRPKWWSELRAANPHKPTQSGTGNWVSLYPNEEIGIPDAWPETSLAVPVKELPAPGNHETPGLPAPGKNTTLDPGVIPHAQALLAKWAFQNPNDCNPSDYARNPMDLVSGITPRTTQALSSFQTWWNKKQPTRALNTTGELDTATYHALIEADNVANAPAPAPQEQPAPAPAPGGNTQPAPTNGAPAGWPKEWPWPFPPTNTAPQQQPQQPEQPAPAPGGNMQPAPTNGAPPGWPKEVPWPFPPTNTTQQQPAPAPGGNTQPAPTNGAPPGWPKDWPWPLLPQNTTQQQPQPEQPAPAPGGNTQPAPTNGAPPGWPKEVPWPFPPTNTTPQQQPAPAPGGNTQPAPTNGAPPGWPKEVPWPFPPTNTTPQQQPAPAPGGNTQPAPTNGAPPGWPKEVPWPFPPTNTTQQQPQQQPAPAPSGNTQPAPSTNTPSQPTSQPQLDNHLPEREKHQLALLLSNGIDADQLDGLAVDYAADGFPLAAAALHARADAIRAQNQNQGPPVIFVIDSPPQPTTPTTESNGSVLPVLALLGAGLALS